MTYLLDTHILLWWLANTSELTPRMKKAIEKPEHTIYVSSVSIWEIATKKSLKKLKSPKDLIERIAANSFEELPVKFAHAAYVEKLPLIHTDPFDRLLIAQSIVNDLVLITVDQHIKSYKG